VGLGRVELPTSRLSGVRSNHLSYRPESPLAATALFFSTKSGKRNEDGEVPQMARCGYIGLVSNENQKPDRGQKLNRFILRKEVIQPQVPLRLPCYDFTPVADLTVVVCLLAVGATPSGKTNSHGVTGGVYKARERIHRGMLIRDY
jgi:hypothetical protein